MTIIAGAIKFVDVPNDFCITNVTELIKFIHQHGKIELDASQITNVVVGVDQPSDTTVIWFRISASGNFIGVYVFVQSQWLPVFPPPQQVIRMYGDSTDIPEGYQLISSGTPGFSAAMVTFLQTQWMPNPSSPGDWLIFDVVYTGV